MHIQSKDQRKNLDFILENLSRFYQEVFSMQENSSVDFKELQRSLCVKCGKHFTNKKGLKQHIMRMHNSTKKRQQLTKNDTVPIITLEEEVNVTSLPDESTSDNL